MPSADKEFFEGGDSWVQLDSSAAWNDKGAALIHMGKFEEALQAFEKVIEIDPGDFQAWYNKACAFRGQGEIAKAIQALREASRLEQNKLDFYFP